MFQSFHDFALMMIKLELDVNLLMILYLLQQEKVKKYFKPVNVVCPECNSHDVVKNGTYSRKLIFLRIREWCFSEI